jgi:Tfp pilus assembly protein PilF
LLNPKLAEAHVALAIIYLRRGDRASALEQYRLLKLIDYDMSQQLFKTIYKDRILDARQLKH